MNLIQTYIMKRKEKCIIRLKNYQRIRMLRSKLLFAPTQ